MPITRAYASAAQPGNAFLAGKNKFINGDFGVWQRGTSFSNPAAGSYQADRFLFNYAGTFNGTISQQTFTPGTAPVSGYEGKYFIRLNRTNTTSIAPTFYQRIEGVRTLAGQTATFSFWAKADANRTISVNIYQAFGTSGSSGVDTSLGNLNITTSWQRFTVTATVPSVSGKTIGTANDDWMTFYLNLTDSVAFTFDFWGFQLEAGSVATAFQTATGTLAGELAACYRYYRKQDASISGQAYAPFAPAMCPQTTIIDGVGIFPVPMRTTPSVTISGVSGYDGVTMFAPSATSFIDGTEFSGTLRLTVTGATQYRPYRLTGNANSAAYIEYRAEL